MKVQILEPFQISKSGKHIFVIQNAKFEKLFLQKCGVNLLTLTKCFSKLLDQSHMIIMIILMFGTIPFLKTIWSLMVFPLRWWNEKSKCFSKLVSRMVAIFLVPLRTFFILKFLKDTNTLCSMEVIWFLLLVHKYYSSFQDFKFHGSCVETLSKHIWFQLLFPLIWQGDSKSNVVHFFSSATQQISHIKN